MPHDVITPDLLLQAYASGIFPMSEGRDDADLFWVDPDERGILPLDRFRISSSLKKTIRHNRFSVRTDTAFQAVMQSCARPARGRETTWISERIETLYTDLFNHGFAHSVECWLDDKLVGGLYGVSLCGAFFGESMFHRETDASKVALAHLVARLKAGGYTLLDTQFVTEHLKQFGAIEIPRTEYHARLRDALMVRDADFYCLGDAVDGSTVLQLITHTS